MVTCNGDKEVVSKTDTRKKGADVPRCYRCNCKCILLEGEAWRLQKGKLQERGDIAGALGDMRKQLCGRGSLQGFKRLWGKCIFSFTLSNFCEMEGRKSKI